MNYADQWWATSPACAETMREAGVPNVVVVPHQPDSRIKKVRFDPRGPVVYWGQGCFADGLPDDFIRTDFTGWDGASAVSGIRSERWRTPIVNRCKPQIKLANAIAAGLPFITSDVDAATSVVKAYADFWKT